MDPLAILVPSRPVLDFFLEGLSVRESPESGGFVFHTGTRNGRRVFMGLYGAEPGDAAAMAEQLITYSKAEGLLALGFAIAPGNGGSLLVSRDTAKYEDADGNPFAAFLKKVHSDPSVAASEEDDVFARKTYHSNQKYVDAALSASEMTGQPAMEGVLVSPAALPHTMEELQHMLHTAHAVALSPFSAYFAAAAARHVAAYVPLNLVVDVQDVCQNAFSLPPSAQESLAAAAGAFMDALHLLEK